MIQSFTAEYRFLSNFYPCPIRLGGHVYPTVEHAFQAAKTLDPIWRERIRNADTPSQAKRLGRQAPVQPGWEQLRIDVMLSCLRQKFAYPRMRQRLLDTCTEPLIEGNTWGDTFWGSCKGVGENNLGKLLMQLREEANEES